MFNYQASIAIVTTIAVLQPTLVVAQDVEKVNNIAKNITVKIVSVEGSGSGVIFEQSGDTYFVVTNQHVVPVANADYQIRTVDDIRHKVIDRQEIPGLDLAIVQFKSPEDYELAEFGNSDELTELQSISVAGFPGKRNDISIVPGEITSILQEVLRNPESEKGYAIDYTNNTFSGTSGGAVLDEEGYLVAINGRLNIDSGSGRDISQGIPINLFLIAKEELETAIFNSQQAETLGDESKISILPDTANGDPSKASQSESQGLNLVDEAITLAQSQEYESALDKAKSAAKLAPDRYETWELLGKLYLQQNRIDEAIVALENAENIDPDNANVLFSLGNAYFQGQEYTLAKEKIEAGLEIKDGSTKVLFHLGNAYFKLAESDRAINIYQQAFATDNTFYPALMNIGLVEYERGNIDAAIALWSEAIEIDDGQAEPKLALAVARYVTGGESAENANLAQLAIETDERYQNLDFLRESLWGGQLVADTENLLREIGY